MAKKMMGSNSNVTKTKAGKKSGGYTSPPAPNKEKQDARILGEQQFQSKVALSVEVSTFKMVDGRIVPITKHVSIPCTWDEKRKHFVYNPFHQHDVQRATRTINKNANKQKGKSNAR